MTALLPVGSDAVVEYALVVDDTEASLAQHIGGQIELAYSGEIHCIHCGRKSKKSFSQGYCYPCFKSLARCDLCIVSPEKCHYYAGTCREPDWADEFCMQEHYVYLANSSGLKVGITRGTQIPTRWIDQGAVAALPVFKVKERRFAGYVEAVYKKYIADKTNWRTMLKGVPDEIDLSAAAAELDSLIERDLSNLQREYGADAIVRIDTEPVAINYPVKSYPQKVSSLNFDKTPTISGVLNGIKGQYLMLDSGVLNIRKFGGYHVNIVLPNE